MAHHIVRMRRLSDIIGQTRKNEYSILLQRVDSEQEAIDAANRFTANFDEIQDFLPANGNALKINIRLTHLPTGSSPYAFVLNKKFDMSAA
jgi:phage protein U